MGRKSRVRLHAFVDEVISIGTRELTASLEIPDAQAREVMREVAHGICQRYARTYMYVPADLEFKRSLRDERIWEQYGQDGPQAKKFSLHRIEELCEEHELTQPQMYAILKVMRHREMARLQPGLPGFDDEDPLPA